MSLAHSLGAITVFWCVLFVIDKALRRYRPWKSSYLQWLEDRGITLSFAHVKCYTTKFNRFFELVSKSSESVCRFWFGLGAFIGVLLMVSSVAVLALTLYQTFTVTDSSQQLLTPVMPGVNLPWRDILYYLLTLVVCGVFHEAGHALAASTEHVRVNGFGMFMLFLYPGAFVDLHSDHLSVISPRRQLRIYCAGVWHNVILVLCALAVLWLLPLALTPLYTTRSGVTVTFVPGESVFADKLQPGYVIRSINTCPVLTNDEWYSCIEELALAPQHGYCVPLETMANKERFSLNQTVLATDGSRECCNEDSLSDICFHVVYSRQRPSEFICLTARTISAGSTCTNARDCKGVHEYGCAFPAVISPSRLVRISHSNGDDVLFLGDPRALAYMLTTSSYIPLSPHTPLWLPDLLQTLCTYFISLSSALALLNMVPAYFLDGQWTLMVLVELLLEKRIPDPKRRRQLCNGILIAGSLLLGSNILLAIWTLVNW